MAKLVIALFLLGVLSSYTNAVKLDRCGIVAALREQGFNEQNLRDWVCLIEHESDGDTGLKGPMNPNGSRDHGLFQINDKYWCSNTSTPGNGCNVTCADVRTDDITKACACARKIFYSRNHNRYESWYGWKNHCKNKPLPDISNC